MQFLMIYKHIEDINLVQDKTRRGIIKNQIPLDTPGE